MSKAFFLAALVAFSEARFNQEQKAAAAVQALSNRGNPGEAATLSGQTPGALLAGANACAKLQLADTIVTTLGSTADVIAAARALVAAEKNTNPFAVAIPSLCSDASLPATAELRGILPLVDPATTGADVENANSASSLQTPFAADAQGISVADLARLKGFSNFTAQAADGSNAAPAGGAANGGAANNAGGGAANNAGGAKATPVVSCGGAAATSAAAGANAGANNGANVGAGAAAGAAGAVVNGVQQSTIAGLNFGLCVPTVKFEPGLNGRKVTEFTFQAIDPLVNKGQQEALNPLIIGRRICDQLTNVCEANQPAKDSCAAALSTIEKLGTKDASTANAWNEALGFAGTNINPDNAPQPGLVGHT